MEVGIAEAKDRLSELIGRAEQGEPVTITRHGRAVVTLTPTQPRLTREEAERIFRELSAFRAQMPRLTDEEIVEAVRDGRKD